VSLNISNSLLSEQLCLIERANKEVKVDDENLMLAKIVNSQYNSHWAVGESRLISMRTNTQNILRKIKWRAVSLHKELHLAAITFL
jgi:hypothetical protein